MKLIVTSIFLQHQTIGPRTSLDREVEKAMKAVGGSVSSASGSTAALAINYCERNGHSYSVEAACVALDGDGASQRYFVKRTS